MLSDPKMMDVFVLPIFLALNAATTSLRLSTSCLLLATYLRLSAISVLKRSDGIVLVHGGAEGVGAGAARERSFCPAVRLLGSGLSC